MAIYCSDASGGFDRVDKGRLVEKLKAKKINPTVVRIVQCWLRNRMAKVLVGGES